MKVCCRFRLLVATLLCAVGLTARANVSHETIDGYTWEYSAENGLTRVWRVQPSEGEIVIPRMLGGCPVVSVELYAFAECYGITSVAIPNSVTNIANGAFCQCRGIKEMTIPASVLSVGKEAFSGCMQLGEISFEGDVPSGFSGAEIRTKTFVWYNARYSVNWQTALSTGGYSQSAPYRPHVCKCRPTPATIHVVSSNVVVNYVLNSDRPEFAIPASQDSGLVNIITEVKGGCVAVPETWAAGIEGFADKFGADFTKALAAKTGKRDGSGNDMCVWQDYVAGTDPTKVDDVFTASITIVGGKIKISYSPELDEERKAMRKYTTWGKKSIVGDEKWVVVEDGDEASFNFFKVSVEMRNPAQDVESWRSNNPDPKNDEDRYGLKAGEMR